MILSFRDGETEDIFDGTESKRARRRLPIQLWRIAQRKLDQLQAASALRDLRSPPGNRLEKLAGDRSDRFSMRINDQYRVCFTWGTHGASDVEIIDYH